MSKPIQTIGERISDALNIRNMSASELSRLTGIPKSSISQYISGYAKPRDLRVSEMAKALSVDVAWLLGFDVPMEKSDQTIIELYNKADEQTKEMVKRILTYSEDMK